MNNNNYHLQLGEMSTFTKRMEEATKGVGQRYIKGSANEFISATSIIYIRFYISFPQRT